MINSFVIMTADIQTVLIACFRFEIIVAVLFRDLSG